MGSRSPSFTKRYCPDLSVTYPIRRRFPAPSHAINQLGGPSLHHQPTPLNRWLRVRPTLGSPHSAPSPPSASPDSSAPPQPTDTNALTAPFEIHRTPTGCVTLPHMTLPSASPESPAPPQPADTNTLTVPPETHRTPARCVTLPPAAAHRASPDPSPVVACPSMKLAAAVLLSAWAALAQVP